MRKFIIFSMIAIATLMLPLMGFAQEVVAAVVPAGPPVWFNEVMSFLVSIPKVGPIINQIVIWLGVGATVFTFLSVFAQGILAIPQVAAKWAGAHDLAEKIKKFSETILPKLQFFSVFNVQKKPEAQKKP